MYLEILYYIYNLFPLRSENETLSNLFRITRFGSSALANIIARVSRLKYIYGGKSLVGESGPLVSLTSFPDRIDNLDLVIYSLGRQSIKPGRIVLTLSKEQYCCLSDVPQRLRRLIRLGLEIKLVDGDLRSYKKFIYLRDICGDIPFVIVDDDILYHPRTIEYLLEGIKHFPKAVIANRCVGMDESLSYSHWNIVRGSRRMSDSYMPTGCGGVFYPKGSLPELAYNKDKAFEICPDGDDIWLKYMSLNNGYSTAYSGFYRLLIPVMNSSKNDLHRVNVGLGKNDENIKKVQDYLAITEGEGCDD